MNAVLQKHLLSGVLILSLLVSRNSAQDLVRSGDRVLFLGDSNTYAGHFVSDIDAFFQVDGKLKLDVINLGLPSETCCGLSEPDHPFPRPSVQERIDRVLEKTKPDVVVACYGMNDGIYHPFDPDRFKTYQAGIRELIDKVKNVKAKLILLTPPPFDPLPLRKKNKLVGKDSKQFAWFLIYEDYDMVMEKYANWILTLKDDVDRVIDIRTPIVRFQSEKRKSDRDFTMSGDGVHFNETCHRRIAETIIRSLLPDRTKIEFDNGVVQVAEKKMMLLRDAWLSETKHKRPGVKPGMPLDLAVQEASKLDAVMRKSKK